MGLVRLRADNVFVLVGLETNCVSGGKGVGRIVNEQNSLCICICLAVVAWAEDDPSAFEIGVLLLILNCLLRWEIGLLIVRTCLYHFSFVISIAHFFERRLRLCRIPGDCGFSLAWVQFALRWAFRHCLLPCLWHNHRPMRKHRFHFFDFCPFFCQFMRKLPFR